uniref:DNA helicase PIF1, ATP-dependent n=1 Tax=Tanacetum cinerariifolium TaxID=118510 RepID=A0A6L2JFZ2_TANCI|nr:DNA helicase PIF1, ATP-dependent [Tanacetum cinerariifolium]
MQNVGAFTSQPGNSNMQCTVGGDYIATPSFTSSESDIHNRSGVQCTISGDYIATPSFTSSDIHKRSVLYTIEFQKRGLLHCHSLIWLSGSSKIDKDSDMDKYISAEFPNPTTKADGYRVISELMIHGPYGYANTNAPCMKDGLGCDRNFPKLYYDRTFIDKDGYVHYRRRETRIDIQRQDRAIMNVTKPVGDVASTSSMPNIQIDEIKNFVEARYIGPHEACWRILDFPIHYRDPAVQILVVHLENMQRITFRSKDNLQSVVNNPTKKKQLLLSGWTTTKIIPTVAI